MEAAVKKGKGDRIVRYAEVLGLYMCLAVFGGFVRLMNAGPGPYTWRDMLKRSVSSAFVGLLAALIMEHFGVSAPMKGAISGACGYAGTDLLRMIAPTMEKLACKRLGLEPPSEKNERE